MGRDLPRLCDHFEIDLFSGFFCDNLELDYHGVPAREMSAEQQRLLLQVAQDYAAHLPEGHAKVRLTRSNVTWRIRTSPG